MKTKKAVKILKIYNKWRRGAEIKQPDPKVIGKAIDKLIFHYEKPTEKLVDIIEKQLITAGFKLEKGEFTDKSASWLTIYLKTNSSFSFEMSFNPENQIDNIGLYRQKDGTNIFDVLKNNNVYL